MENRVFIVFMKNKNIDALSVTEVMCAFIINKEIVVKHVMEGRYVKPHYVKQEQITIVITKDIVSVVSFICSPTNRLHAITRPKKNTSLIVSSPNFPIFHGSMTNALKTAVPTNVPICFWIWAPMSSS